MQADARVYTLPRWRVTRWLLDAGPQVPADIRVALAGNLFGSLPIFVGGAINTILVASVVAYRLPSVVTIAWLGLEIAICLARLSVLIVARRAALARQSTPTDLYVLLAVAWSASVGYGVLISLASGDWVVATLACLSAAAMVGGICFRNFSAPQLAGTMIVLSLGPCLPGAALAGEPLLYVVFWQVPMYLVAMSLGAFKLNKMLITTILAERAKDHRARHDALTELPNRAELADAVEARRKAGREHAFALMFLDLDGFKAVNDTYGHAAGDQLLRMVAARLKSMLRAGDVAARIGGDEFVVLAERVSQVQAIAFAERLIATVATSYDLGDGIAVRIGVSAGIAMAPQHGAALDDLLAAADAALYEAKSSGKARCCMAAPQTNLAALTRLHRAGTEGIGVAA